MQMQFEIESYSGTMTFLNDEQIHLKLTDKKHLVCYATIIESNNTDLKNMVLSQAFTLMEKCFQNEPNHCVEIYVKPENMVAEFTATFDYFNIDLKIILRRELLSNDEQLTMRINRYETTIEALTQKINKLEQLIAMVSHSEINLKIGSLPMRKCFYHHLSTAETLNINQSIPLHIFEFPYSESFPIHSKELVLYLYLNEGLVPTFNDSDKTTIPKTSEHYLWQELEGRHEWNYSKIPSFYQLEQIIFVLFINPRDDTPEKYSNKIKSVLKFHIDRILSTQIRHIPKHVNVMYKIYPSFMQSIEHPEICEIYPLKDLIQPTTKGNKFARTIKSEEMIKKLSFNF
jgi:hypothetical protein